MNAFFALVRKDLVLYFSNRRSVLMSIVAPILIAAFFGSLFGGGESKPASIPIAVTDLDRSPLSAKIVAALRADSALTVSEVPEAGALAQVKAGKQRAAVTLPAGFGAQASGAFFGATPKPEIGLHYDPSQALVLPLVRGLLAQHVMEQVSQAAFRGATSSASPPASASAHAGPSFSLPYATREVEASSKPDAKYNSYAHSFAGMGVQFILMMGVDVAVGLLLMRRMGLWKRLRAAPLSRGKLLGSRVASCALIAFIVFAVIYAVAMAVFKVRVEGSVPGFVLVLLAFSVLTACFGLLIAALGKTPEATRGLAILATLLLVMLGGAWVPAFIFPAWLQQVSLLAPTRWAIDGLDAMTWRGLPFEAALLPVAVMLAFSAAFAVIAVMRFQWEE
jgi:ABC-2 type transport system permease protein